MAGHDPAHRSRRIKLLLCVQAKIKEIQGAIVLSQGWCRKRTRAPRDCHTTGMTQPGTGSGAVIGHGYPASETGRSDGRSGTSSPARSGGLRASGPFHLILQVLMQTATSREAAKIAKGSGWGRYTDFASSRSSRELMGCQVKY
jgi:hypothetical protein